MPAKKTAEEADTTSQTAAMSEATGQPVTVVHNGDTYTIDLDALDSIEFLEAAQAGRDVLMLAAILGPAQWSLFKGRNKARAQVQEMFELIGKAAGTGNS